MVVSCPSALAAAIRLSIDCCAKAMFVVIMSATAETLVSFFQVLRIFLPSVLCEADAACIIAHINSACHFRVGGYLVDYSVSFQKLYKLAKGKCPRPDARLRCLEIPTSSPAPRLSLTPLVRASDRK